MSPIHIVAMALLAAASTECKSINPNQKNAFLDMVGKMAGPEIEVCDGCLNLIGTVEEMIENGYIHEEIISAMRAVCKGISIFFPTIGDACFTFVDDMDQILDDIIDGIFTPEHICCEMFHACEGAACGNTTYPPSTQSKHFP